MIFTFYSYKGGVGRSMAVAAVAHLLARRGMKVLVVDFDLEAPGLERYFFDNEQSRLKRTEPGLMDLIQAYRRALTDEAEFRVAEFKQLDRFTSAAIVEASSRGGSVDIMTAGRREPSDKMREYALAVRSFDWQDFFYNWKGDRFFEWLRGQWISPTPEKGYDVVLVDSRTGVTEMGGICAYQLADVAVLLCAPNYQNLEGTRDVARDFVSDAVLSLRQGRKLDILVIPARVDNDHPKCAEFLTAFDREIGSEGLPLALAQLGIGYRDLVLPYLPEFAIEEQLVGEELSDAKRTLVVSKIFERLADALTILAGPNDTLSRFREESLSRLRGEATPVPTMIQANTSRTTAGFDFFLDCGPEDQKNASILTHELEVHGLKVFMSHSPIQKGGSLSVWSEEIEQALNYSATLLVCFGSSTSSLWRDRLLSTARRSKNKRIIPVLFPGAGPTPLQAYGLDTIEALDLRGKMNPEELDKIAEEMKRLTASSSESIPQSITYDPYIGGRAFTEDDARFFHGRADAVASLLTVLEEHFIVLLEGPAKVGKTSLASAGLIPLLRKRKLDQNSWVPQGIRMINADSNEFNSAEAYEITSTLTEKPTALLIIDSIDSFTATPSSLWASRLRKIEALVAYATSTLRVVLIWRGTLPESKYHATLQLWQQRGCHRVELLSLSGEALRRAIEQPAREAGHLLENGLTERLIESSGNAKNAIFQIQLALTALWQERRRGWLTNKSLDALGHLGTIFQDHIDNTLASFGESDLRATTVLFKSLSKLGARLELIPQSRSWSEIETIPAIARVDGIRIRDQLVMSGLIDLWREDSGLEASLTIERARVALVRPDPMNFMRNGNSVPDAYFFMWRAQLATYVLTWNPMQGNIDALLTGSILAEAEHWLNIRMDEVTEIERKFIAQSRQHADLLEEIERQKSEEKRLVSEKLAQVELKAAKERGEAAEILVAEQKHATQRLIRHRRHLQVAIIFMFILSIVAIYGFFYAENQRKYAVAAQKNEKALRLTAHSLAMASGAQSGSDERAILQLLAAWHTVPANEIESALLTMLISKRSTLKIIAVGEPVAAAAISFSPDGEHIVLGSAYVTLRLWDSKTAQFIGQPLVGHTAEVSSISFSPDRRRLVSGSFDKTLRLWDATTGLPIGDPLRGHEDKVLSVAFSPDGHYLVSQSSDNTLRLWNAWTGLPIGDPMCTQKTIASGPFNKPKCVPKDAGAPKDTVASVTFSPDSSRIVSGGGDNTLQLWDVKTSQPIGEPLRGHTSIVTSVAFSPDGARIVSGSFDKTLRLWNAGTKQPIGEPLRGHVSIVTSVAFSPDGARIVSGSFDKTLRLWDARTGQPIGEPLRGHMNTITSVAFSPDGVRIISGSLDETLRLWDSRTASGIGETLRGHEDKVSSVAFSPDGDKLVSGSFDNSLRVWDVRTGQLIGDPLRGHEDKVSSVAFSPDGDKLVSGSFDNSLRLWDVKTGQPIGEPICEHESPRHSICVPQSAVASVTFSPDGNSIASGGESYTLRLWNTRTRQLIGTPLLGHKNQVSSVAFSPEGDHLVSGSFDQTLRLWDARTRQLIGSPFSGHDEAVTSVAFSSDGTRIVSGSFDNTLRLWDVRTGQPIGKPMRAHEDAVMSVAFSPDGTRIVSGSFDKTLRLWDVRTGQPIGDPLLGHEDAVMSVAFSPDGTRIVSGSNDNTLRLWPAPKIWADELCKKLTRNLSRKEWDNWISPDIDIPYLTQCQGLPIR